MTDHETLELLRDRVRSRRVIPFVGAGISQPVLKKGWDQTIREVTAKAGDLSRLARKELLAVLDERGPTVAAEVLRQELQAPSLANAVRRALLRRGQKPDDGHMVMVNGPWPAIVTTNWDPFLEVAWKKGSAALDPPKNAHQAWGKDLRVFYRAEIESFHAHLKAGVRPLLFKMHGDFERRDEFVLGESDYRKLLVRDVSLRSLMTLLTAEYSLLFYGCSMTDPDVLEFLAATHEGLGHGIGPHFWLTFDSVPAPLARFLRQHYNLLVIQAAQERLIPTLREVANTGWETACRTELTVHVTDHVQVRLTGDGMPPIAEAPKDEALAISVGVTASRIVVATATPGSQILRVLGGAEQAAGTQVDEDGVGTCRVKGRTVWLICGQEPGRHGRAGRVHRAVSALLRQALAKGVTCLHLPLVAAGGGTLPARESLHATLHAIGQAAAHVSRPFEIVIHAYRPEAEFSPMADMADGRITPARILDRGLQNRIRCTAIHPAPDDLSSVVCSSVFAPADGTVGELLEQLRLPERPPAGRWLLRYQRGDRKEVPLKKPTRPLLQLDVTDGSLIAIVSSKD